MKAIDEVYRSNYIKADDLPEKGAWFTVRDAEWVSFPDSNNKDVEKLVLDFEETSRRLVMNKTNAQVVAEKLATKQPDEWLGAGLFLKCEQVFFGGRMVPSVRVKDAMRTTPTATLKAVAKPAARPELDYDDPGPSDEDFLN
jgi:hypothetical protein